METEQLQAVDKPGQKLRLDEKVEWIWEVDANGPVCGLHRYQHIQLARDGRMRHFKADLGSTVAHPHWQQFNFWAGGEYSVGEVLEIAERLRESKPPENDEPLDLAQSYLRQCEERLNERAHRSVFGPRLQKVR